MDEALAYEGVVAFQKPYPHLARVYAVVARRGISAWKVGRSLVTALLPGMDVDDYFMWSNDHARRRHSEGSGSMSPAE